MAWIGALRLRAYVLFAVFFSLQSLLGLARRWLVPRPWKRREIAGSMVLHHHGWGLLGCEGQPCQVWLATAFDWCRKEQEVGVSPCCFERSRADGFKIVAIHGLAALRSNEAPKPFLWTKTADQSLAGVARLCARTIEQATS
jgi:hypothetical protein